MTTRLLEHNLKFLRHQQARLRSELRYNMALYRRALRLMPHPIRYLHKGNLKWRYTPPRWYPKPTRYMGLDNYHKRPANPKWLCTCQSRTILCRQLRARGQGKLLFNKNRRYWRYCPIWQ